MYFKFSEFQIFKSLDQNFVWIGWNFCSSNNFQINFPTLKNSTVPLFVSTLSLFDAEFLSLRDIIEEKFLKRL